MITWSAEPGVQGCGGLLALVQWVHDHLVGSTWGTGVWRTTYTGTVGSLSPGLQYPGYRGVGDYLHRYSGFLITWSAVPGVPGCGGLLTQVQRVSDHLVGGTRGPGVWGTTYTGTVGS